MYALASKLVGLPVLSLQSADTLSLVTGLIVQRETLQVVAFTCQPVERAQHNLIVLPQDIRQLATDCLVVDSEQSLIEGSEVVRLAPLLDRPYQPIGRVVVTELRRTLGRAEDYTVNLETYALQKLYVRQSMLRSWIGASLIIDRQQIIDVTEREIVVREAAVTSPATGGWFAPKPVPKQ